MDGLNLEDLCVMCRDNKVKWTLHALKRIRERQILPDTVIHAILSGKIIEEYKGDKYFPSCLIFNGNFNSPLHVVVSTDKVSAYIITVYQPALNEWENDFETRKENR